MGSRRSGHSGEIAFTCAPAADSALASGGQSEVQAVIQQFPYSYQPPHLIPDQAAQGPIQPGLEHLQGRGIHSLSGQPVPAPNCSLGKELPRIANLNLPSFNLKPFPLVLLLSILSKS